MEKKEDKKPQMLDGFFDKCRNMYSEGQDGVKDFSFDEKTGQTTAEIKLDKIRRILLE